MRVGLSGSSFGKRGRKGCVVCGGVEKSDDSRREGEEKGKGLVVGEREESESGKTG